MHYNIVWLKCGWVYSMLSYFVYSLAKCVRLAFNFTFRNHYFYWLVVSLFSCCSEVFWKFCLGLLSQLREASLNVLWKFIFQKNCRNRPPTTSLHCRNPRSTMVISDPLWWISSGLFLSSYDHCPSRISIVQTSGGGTHFYSFL
jgi:hypothetical protein